MSASRTIIRRAALLPGLAILLGSCTRPPEPSPRLVLLYATCSLNRSYLSPYNEAVSYTPSIERFARKSVVFSRHTTEAGQSGPAFAALFSGRQADEHGVFVHPTALSDDLYLISEAYADRGYRTFFWNAHVMASADLNYAQGIRPRRTFPSMLRGDSPEFHKLLEKARNDEGYRALVITNFTVTHAPYSTDWLEGFLERYPAERKSLTPKDVQKYHGIYLRYCRELQMNFPETVTRLGLSSEDVERLAAVLDLVYKSNVWHLDGLFGEVVARIEGAGLLDDSLIAFTADHGEILYRENALLKWTHGEQLTPEVLDVPLIVYSPELEARPRRRFDRVSRSIDVFPTMMGLSGLPLPPQAGISGADLSPALLGRRPDPDLPAYSHTCVPHESVLNESYRLHYQLFPRADVNLIWVSVRAGDTVHQLRNLDGRSWGVEVFDLKADPGETRNLYDPRNGKHRETAKALRRYKEHLVERYDHFKRDKAGKAALPPEDQIERLRSLGYVK